MSVREIMAQPPLRFRRFGGGYRREDVELVLAELRLTLRSFELELSSLRERARDLEAELREARGEIAGFQRQGYEIAQAMTSARDRAAELEREAEARARELVSQAEAVAERVRIETEGAIEGRREELARLTVARAALIVRLRSVLRDFESVLVNSLEPEPEPGAESEVEPAREQLEQALSPRGPAPAEEALFPREVELDAGPFPDFDAVSAFERELAQLPRVEDVHIARLDGDRAVIELTLTESADLLADLREHLPYALELRRGTGRRLVVDVDPPSTAGGS